MARLFVLVFCLLLLGGPPGWISPASAAKPAGVQKSRAVMMVSRSFVFPGQVSLGKLYFYADSEPGGLPWHCDVVFAQPGSSLGEARGFRTLKLPEHSRIYLFPSYHLLEHPDLFKLIDPNCFDGLSFGKTSLMVPVENCLSQLLHLKGLRRLELEGAELSDSQIVPLKGLINLESLSLPMNTIDGTCFSQMQSLSKLRELDLSLNKISPEGFRAISRFKSLEVLYLDKSGVNDAALEHLTTLPKLKHLGIGQSKLTARGLSLIKKMKSIEIVDLEGAPLAVKDFAVLQGSKVSCLSLSGKQFSATQLKQIRGLLPGVVFNITPVDSASSDHKMLFAPLH
ncbi:MAG: hypothetical protein HC888_08360 [Candidatus Competibacteraceae bacterium]|nr:hypothetical protein [Candidatus Competibacteraceae bacterium]